MGGDATQIVVDTRESCFLNSPLRRIHAHIPQNVELSGQPRLQDQASEYYATRATLVEGWSLPAETGRTSPRKEPPLRACGRPPHCESCIDLLGEIWGPQVLGRSKPFLMRLTLTG